MSDYLIAVMDGLEQNATIQKIDKWFFFVTWKDIVNVGGDGYMGIILFDGPEQGAGLNCLGKIYRAYSLGDAPLRCNSAGDVMPRVNIIGQ